jgi:ribosome-binding factor A
MKSFKRSKRVADQIKRDASEIIADMMQDRGSLMVTVSGVEVSDDLRYAKIFYTVLGDEDKRGQAEEIFGRSTGYIQGELARRLRLRRMPEISLQYDTSLVEGMRIASLIEDVMSKSDDDNDDAN